MGQPVQDGELNYTLPFVNEERIAVPARPAWALPLTWTAVVCLYTALTLVYFWPLPRLWQDHIGPELGDPLFVLYVLKWGVHQIRLGLPDLWNANFFYPTRGALALSDHLLGPAAELALFETVIPNAIAGFNFLFLSSFVASALATCWVLRRCGLSWVAAVLGGWMFAYSPFRVSQTPHLQILIAQWIPLTLWFWDRLLAERTAKNAALFLLFYLLNLSGGCYLAYMIHFPLAAILASRALEQRRSLLSWRSLRLFVPIALVVGAAGAALFLPYLRIAHTLGLTRGHDEIQEFGATLASYFSPSAEGIYFGPPVRQFLRSLLGDHAEAFFRSENSLFAGFLPTILFVVGAVAAWRSRREGSRDAWARGLALSGLVCFALSLAIVYEPLMRVVPGLSGMRVPARFYAFVSLTVVFFAARGIDVLLRRLPGPRARAALVAGLAVVLAVELAPRKLPWRPLALEEEMPEVYTWIRDQPAIHALIELPIHSDTRENQFLYASTVHWKPIANGYSGYLPKAHEELVKRIRFLPGPAGLDLLRELWITHILVHARRADRAEAVQSWEERFATGPNPQVERVYAADGFYVYHVLGAPPRNGP
ncbi:MAG TPA: hypothetical protein VGS07_04565 [Thermoanaerobaculia bacterium]|jgi:hypothetical protein|nr:hypothetical protein [Thermoanaerobaculia bacterium]